MVVEAVAANRSAREFPCEMGIKWEIRLKVRDIRAHALLFRPSYQPVETRIPIEPEMGIFL